MQVCKTCGIDKPFTDFTFAKKKKKDGTIYFKHLVHCKACRSLKYSAWLAENRDTRNKYEKERRKTEKRKLYNKKHQHKYIECARNWRKRNPDKHLLCVKNWREKNKEKVKSYRAKHRIAKFSGFLSDKYNDEIEKIYKEATDKTEHTGIKYHVDHIVPLQGKNVCGLHVPWSLRAIPAKDNLKKSNKYI